MTVTKLSLLVASASYCLGQTQQPTATLNGVKVDVALKEELKQRFSLKISVSNEASPTLSTEGLYPPWSFPDGMAILGVFAVDKPDRCPSCFYSRPLRRQWTLADYRLRVETVPIGSRLEDSITLNDKFPELIETLRKYDVLVFWSLQIVPAKGPALARFGGWTVIPSKGK